MFGDLFRYVQDQKQERQSKNRNFTLFKSKDTESGVQILSREIVGSYDVAVVSERKSNSLNGWLNQNGYQTLDASQDKEVLEFYRRKNYVFACIKVAAAELKQKRDVDLHPLRFRFETGGRDGIYFPMKLTGLQSDPFDVNLYVFYNLWLNDEVSKFGYVNRGFELQFRDTGTAKSFTDDRYQSLAAFTGKHHKGETFYLTNIQAIGLKPEDVRRWKDDLWLFPYYTSELFVPYDARPGGNASAGWPDQRVDMFGNDPDVYVWYRILTHPAALGVCGLLLVCVIAGLMRWLRRRRGMRPVVESKSGQ